MKFAIIGPDTFNTKSLVREISRRGFAVVVYNISDIAFSVDTMDEEEFFQHDIYIFRGFNQSVVFAQLLAYNLHIKNKLVIDTVLASSYIPTKVYEALQFKLNNIPHPKTVYARSWKQWKRVLSKLDTPIILKPEQAQKGQGVNKYETKEQALEFLREHPIGYLAQEYVPLRYDIRVFVVGDMVLGAIKRYANEGDFRTNASLGGKVEEYDLSQEEKALALRAHKLFGYDISGVDLIKRGSDSLVLEVNIPPQWEAFQSATGINVANHIINHILKRYEKAYRIS